MRGEHLGVPYALTLGGELADPATAPQLERGYTCLACGEFVFVRRGRVRAPHFAHYADREVPCSRETGLHEAAKRRLVEMLRAGTRVFWVKVACPGFDDEYGTHVDCSGDRPAVMTLRLPPFDEAAVEVAFGPYRLDAAATRAGRVVVGLEVYQSHQVDDGKLRHLQESGLPWLEVEASEVLDGSLPWAAVSSHFGRVQCPECRRRSERAARERRRLEAERRSAEERARRAAAQCELEARCTFVAWDGRQYRTPGQVMLGARLRCPACKAVVTAQLVNGDRVFLHDEGMQCDPVAAWVRAGMGAIYWQLTRAPEAVRIRRRCQGDGLDECNAILTELLPEFDEVRPAGDSLVLEKDGGLVG